MSEYVIHLPLRLLPHKETRSVVTKSGKVCMYQDPQGKHYKQLLGWYIKQAAVKQRMPVLEGAIAIDVQAYFTRPKTVKHPFPITRNTGDEDNLKKPLYDAMSGICYKDDSQIVRWSGGKHYTSTDDYAIITIRELAEEV